MTKRLSRNEVVELRARAIFKARKPTAVWEQWDSQPYYEQAEATIEADENAGVLALITGEIKEGDLIQFITQDKSLFVDSQNLAEYVNKGKDAKIIQRNSTPVYHCKEGN